MQPQKIPERTLGLLALSLLAVGVGVVTGVGALAFRALIGVIHNAAYYGHFSFFYDANRYDAVSPWGPGIILVPIIGGLGVVFLVAKFAPEARGHGVPEVMDAIFYREGRIRPVVAAVKSLASALSIGTGAAVGREGPIIQIGASLGSTTGQLIRLEAWQRITLVSAGAGAGIAATFNTPLGGVMFAIELMMPEVSVRTFLPVALATGTATFIGRYFLGVLPAFQVPAHLPLVAAPTSLNGMLICAVLGAICGVAATAFIRALHTSEKWFERVRNPYLRHALGMTGVGLMMYGFLLGSGHYRIDGVGYSTVQDILFGGLAAGPLLALLFASKLTATSLSLGSGSSGGIFSPSLFMGATIGGAFGAFAHRLLGFPDITVPAFAMIGMSAMVGGHRCGDDSHHDDFRDDARLRDRDAHDCRGGRQYRRASLAERREHLHDQAGRQAALHSQGDACQHVFDSARRGGDGAGLPTAACRQRIRSVPTSAGAGRGAQAHRGHRG